MPRAPLPDSGFMMAVGSASTNSAFDPVSPTSHLMAPMSQSMAPEARNTPMATRMATR